MTDYMTTEKQDYIEKLEKQINAIDNILKMDSGTVVDQELRKKLRALKSEAETVLRKLKNNEFEIAIVGLEKAGKSTFANALMENNLLPTKDSRCTFTSTQIEYSGDDKDDSAIVSFYDQEEFDKDFKDKLCKLGFPNYERYSFDTIGEKQYMSLYENEVSDEKKRLYGDSIHEDIVAIIKNVNSLSELLGRPAIPFGAERINSGELEAYITDEAKARAVKQVIIRSKKLGEMKNAVIFDVPGFNSPTELHKIQTLERMRSADAIVVVANGISPSLTGESLKILRESDDNGNPLNEKLFVFVNKIEGARDISLNISDTINEWTSKEFVAQSNKHRIVFGSALAHLQSVGLDKDNRVLKQFEERKSELPNGDGIDAIRKKLAEYNNNERFEVLKRRINRIKANIVNAFKDIRSSGDNIAAVRSYSAEQVALVGELIDASRAAAEKKLLDLKAEIRSYMPTEQPLSKQITEYVSTNVTAEKYSVTDEELDLAKKQTPYIGNHDDVERIEINIRQDKFAKMYEDFSENVINIADKYHAEYSEQILGIMLDAMEVDTNSPYYGELKESLKSEIAAFRGGILSSGNSSELYYQSLIERYSRYIYQILITSPYNNSRLREFYDSIDNLYSLSVFYRTPDCKNDLAYIDIAPKDQPLCMMLLFHHRLNAADKLRTLTDEISRITGLKEIPNEIWKFAEKAFNAVCGKTGVVVEAVNKLFSKAANANAATDEFKIGLTKTALSQLVESNEPCSVADKEGFTRFYDHYHSTLRGGCLYTVDDFRKDFDVDIQILQDILINAFVRAISVEKPFVAREVKSIDDIIDYTKGKSFRDFLSLNFYKIKYKETQVLDKQRREQEQNAAIINAISGILNTLGN